MMSFVGVSAGRDRTELAKMSSDQELTTAFAELQAKMVETNQRVRVAEGQMLALKRSIARSQLTEKEIAGLPEDINMYKGVGRMFLLQPQSALRTALQQQQREAEDKIKEIQANVSYWERSLKESEEGVRELLTQRKNK